MLVGLIVAVVVALACAGWAVAAVGARGRATTRADELERTVATLTAEVEAATARATKAEATARAAGDRANAADRKASDAQRKAKTADKRAAEADKRATDSARAAREADQRAAAAERQAVAAAATQAEAEERAQVASDQAHEAGQAAEAATARAREIEQQAADAVARAVVAEAQAAQAEADAVALARRADEAEDRRRAADDAITAANERVARAEADVAVLGRVLQPEGLWALDRRRLDRLWRDRLALPGGPSWDEGHDATLDVLTDAVKVLAEASREETGVVVDVDWRLATDVTPGLAALIVRLAEELVAAARDADGAELTVDADDDFVRLALATEPPIDVPADLAAAVERFGPPVTLDAGVLVVRIPAR